jgi:hypothetical protein
MSCGVFIDYICTLFYLGSDENGMGSRARKTGEAVK